MVTNDLAPAPTVAAEGKLATTVVPPKRVTVTDELPIVTSFVAVIDEAAAVLPITVKFEPVVTAVPAV